MRFYGREQEIAFLRETRDTAERVARFTVVTGRRRIGKTTLIERFAQVSGARLVKIEGLKPKAGLSNDDELAHFAKQLHLQTGAEETKPPHWLAAFVRLDRELAGSRKTVVLLDEVSWMAHYDPTFTGTLKIAWDSSLSKLSNQGCPTPAGIPVTAV